MLLFSLEIIFTSVAFDERNLKMNKFAIIGDSTCDLTKELRENNNIDYCKMKVSWRSKDGVDHEMDADLDWPEMSHEDFFDLLASGVRVFTTQVTEQEFDRVFTEHLEKGEDILYIGCSGKLSASVSLAQRLINEKFSKKYPDRKIYAVDPYIACMGQGRILLDAAEMREAGKTIDEIKEYIERERNCYHQACTLENLDTLARAGRVKASKAFFANLIGVKPILISDAVGNNVAPERQKGRRNALLRLVEMIKADVVKPEEQICWISDAESRPEDVELLVSNIKAAVPFKDVRVVPMGPIIGASTGKGTISAYFKGTEVTFVQE